MPHPVPPTTSRLLVKREGRAITGKVPKPVVLGDTREQSPLDPVATRMHHRERFFRELERMQSFVHRAILVEASYEDVKSPYRFYNDITAHPNGVSGSLDALEARYGIPVIYTSRNRALAEEKAASWLSKTFTYWWLESNGMGRVLQEGDL